MRVSLNTIKQYIDFELPAVDELVKRINEQLGGVEEVIDLNEKYKDAIVVKVVESEKHPNADRLNVTKIDDGGVVANIPRDENGLVQVVCGAPNVHADMFAVWLPPKSTVPASFGDKEPFVLDARELRGVMSQGMLAAGDELAINGDHDGIIEINPGELNQNTIEFKPGVSFAELYGLDDTLIDIENKMFTHRPDLFGQLGVAREIAGILGHQFKSPQWYLDKPEFSEGFGLDLAVFNDAPDNAPRFMAVALKNVEVKPSPLWLQIELMRLGSKSINNIVDITNYIMLLTAQPTHAYDYDKLRGGKLGVRMARNGEKVTLLNHKEYELTESDIVIVDGEGPVGLAGIMGGGESEVDENTKNIVLEVATFDMYTLRKSSMRHGVFTDALTRFNKGQSPLQNDRIINLLIASIKDVSNVEQASEVFDLNNLDVLQLAKALPDDMDEESFFVENPGLLVTAALFINDRLGLNLSVEEITTLLRNVEIQVNEDAFPETLKEYGYADLVTVAPPFWRTDLEFPEDIVEEVGRLYGFDKLPQDLPARSMKPTVRNEQRVTKNRVRDALSRAGANEVLTYSFVHENTMKKTAQNHEFAYQLSNALSPDLQYYRLSLTPSLLANINANMRSGHEKFALFEIGKTHFKGEMDHSEPDVPNEDTHVALVVACNDKQKPKGAPYFYAVRYLSELVDLESTTLISLKDFDTSSDLWGKELAAPYEPNRSAVIVKDDQIWGVVGEFKSEVRRALKLPEFSAGFEVHINTIRAETTAYKPLSRYPSITQDLSLKVASSVSYQQLTNAIKSSCIDSEFDIVMSPVAIYQPEAEADTKTITVRVKVTSLERTLREEEVTKLVDAMTATASDSFAAIRI